MSVVLRTAGRLPYAVMLGIFEPGRLVLFRRVGGRLVHWRTIEGDENALKAAMWAAGELTLAAREIGGWSEALRLGLNPAKPVKAARVVARILPHHDLNGGFGELERPSGHYRKGSTVVDVDDGHVGVRLTCEFGNSDA